MSEDDEKMIALWREGQSFKQIADALGRTKGSIAGRLFRMRAAGLVFDENAPPPLLQIIKPPAPIEKAPEPVEEIFIKLKPPLKAANDEIIKGKDLKTLFDITSNDCHYVIGRGESLSIYCAAPVYRRKMCKEHYRLCYIRVAKSKNSFVMKNF